MIELTREQAADTIIALGRLCGCMKLSDKQMQICHDISRSLESQAKEEERKLRTSDFDIPGLSFREGNQRPGVATEKLEFDLTPGELDDVMEVLGFAMKRRDEKTLAAGILLASICRTFKRILIECNL